jgi:hypothetical protein
MDVELSSVIPQTLNLDQDSIQPLDDLSSQIIEKVTDPGVIMVS